MPAATITVQPGYIVDNTQKKVIVSGNLVCGPAANTYAVGGIPLDAVLLALPQVNTNSGVLRVVLASNTGTGYVFQRIAATGKMMILQVPPSGSLTTAAPLQEIPTSTDMHGVANDTINFEAEFLRNA